MKEHFAYASMSIKKNTEKQQQQRVKCCSQIRSNLTVYMSKRREKVGVDGGRGGVEQV